MKTNIHFWSYPAQFVLEWEMFRTKIVEKIKTHILCSTFLLFCFNRVAYEIKWKNIVEPDRPHMTIWRLCIACCILKATNVHSDYILLIAFPLQQWLYERSSMLRLYLYCLPYCNREAFFFQWGTKCEILFTWNNHFIVQLMHTKKKKTYLLTYSMEQSPSWEANQ